MGRWQWLQKLIRLTGQQPASVNNSAAPIPPVGNTIVRQEENIGPDLPEFAEGHGIEQELPSEEQPIQAPATSDVAIDSALSMKRSAEEDGKAARIGIGHDKLRSEDEGSEGDPEAVILGPIVGPRNENDEIMAGARPVSEAKSPRPYPQLGVLHRAMMREGLNRIIFTGTNNGSHVETLFCADDDPMVLCVAVTHSSGAPTCALELDVVMPEYRVNTYLGDKYGDLLDALGLVKGRRGKKAFKTSDFLINVLRQAPRVLNGDHEPRPSQVYRLRVASTVEEANKTFFIGWRDNQRWRQHVTVGNLRKTARLIGSDCARMCELRNISTCWSDKPGRREPRPSEITQDAHQGFTGDWG